MDLDKIPPVDCFKALMLILDALIEDEETQVLCESVCEVIVRCDFLLVGDVWPRGIPYRELWHVHIKTLIGSCAERCLFACNRQLLIHYNYVVNTTMESCPPESLSPLQVHGISVIMECEGLGLFDVMKASTSEFARSNVLFDLVQVSAL